MGDSMAGGSGKRHSGQGRRAKGTFGLGRVVEHPVRLDILNCVDGEPLTMPLLSARIGGSEKRMSYHLKVLYSFGLVIKAGDGQGGSLYVARLKDQPCWVTRAVNQRLLV
jgi:DNA-binding transcriptional ArsR family regulator